VVSAIGLGCMGMSANYGPPAGKAVMSVVGYLRELMVEVLSEEGAVANWYDKVPPDVQAEITKLEAAEEMKSWMSLGSRNKSALMTLPSSLG
jgi:hypothetical protein